MQTEMSETLTALVAEKSPGIFVDRTITAEAVGITNRHGRMVVGIRGDVQRFTRVPSPDRR